MTPQNIPIPAELRALQVPDTFEGRHVRICIAQPEDAFAVWQMWCDSADALREFPESVPWAMETLDLGRARNWCRVANSNFVDRVDFQFLIWRGTRVCGNVALFSIDVSACTAEVGYYGRSTNPRAGIVTEAMNALAGWASATLPIRTLYATPEEKNERSTALLRRCGYRFAGAFAPGRVKYELDLKNSNSR